MRAAVMRDGFLVAVEQGKSCDSYRSVVRLPWVLYCTLFPDGLYLRFFFLKAKRHCRSCRYPPCWEAGQCPSFARLRSGFVDILRLDGGALSTPLFLHRWKMERQSRFHADGRGVHILYRRGRPYVRHSLPVPIVIPLPMHY